MVKIMSDACEHLLGTHRKFNREVYSLRRAALSLPSPRRAFASARHQRLAPASSAYKQSKGKWNSRQQGHRGKWGNWRGKQGRWQDSLSLQRETQRKLLKPTSAVPLLAGLVIAGMFGPVVFTIAASALGLAFAAVAGMTAVALFLPAAFFVGGTLAAFTVLGSIFSLLGLVPLVALGWTLYNRSGKAKMESGEKQAALKRDEWQAKEYRRQQEEQELLQVQEQELEDFDRRLRSR